MYYEYCPTCGACVKTVISYQMPCPCCNGVGKNAQ